MSYFAPPNFIIYDEWFDDDLEKKNLDNKNKNLKNISNIHEFFYEKSNIKVGASENNFHLEIKVNKKELITENYFKNYFKNNSEKFTSISNKKFLFFEKLTKSKVKFNFTKKLIYSLSILGFVLIFGFLIIFIWQSKENESNISNSFFSLEKEF